MEIKSKHELSIRLQNSLTKFNLSIEEALELEYWKLKNIGFGKRSIIEINSLKNKQETLEELDYQQELFNYLSNELGAIALQSQMHDIENIILKSQEQRYSEEEIVIILDSYNKYLKGITKEKSVEEWFEQFKKK